MDVPRVFDPVALQRAEIVAIAQFVEQLLEDCPISVAAGSPELALEVAPQIGLDVVVVDQCVVDVDEEYGGVRGHRQKNSGGAACADRLDNDNTITIRGHGAISVSLDLMDFVPQADCRFGAVIVLVVEDAEARGSEQEAPSSSRVEAEPARGEHSQDMAARKQQQIAVGGMHALDHTVGPGAHLRRRLSLRTAVAEQEPARALGEEFGGAPALVTAVIPFGQV